MDLTTSLRTALDGVVLDDLLVWAIAILAGVVALIALVNALDMFMDTEAG